jgi:hypothetical protein
VKIPAIAPNPDANFRAALDSKVKVLMPQLQRELMELHI